MILLVLLACNGDPELSMRGAPYCQVEEGDPKLCDAGRACCDDQDCWFEFNGRRYDCTTRWDCDDAIDAFLADICDI